MISRVASACPSHCRIRGMSASDCGWQEGLHGPAERVAADDDVADLERLTAYSMVAASPLSGAAPYGGIRLPAFRRTNRSPGSAWVIRFGHDPRVRAGDEQGLRVLPGGEPLEQLVPGPGRCRPETCESLERASACAHPRHGRTATRGVGATGPRVKVSGLRAEGRRGLTVPGRCRPRSAVGGATGRGAAPPVRRPGGKWRAGGGQRRRSGGGRPCGPAGPRRPGRCGPSPWCCSSSGKEAIAGRQLGERVVEDVHRPAQRADEHQHAARKQAAGDRARRLGRSTDMLSGQLLGVHRPPGQAVYPEIDQFFIPSSSRGLTSRERT